MYAIIETGGKQYKVQTGDVVFVEKLNAEEDAEIVFDKVVAVCGDDGIKAGAPYVQGATVAAKVVKNGKAKKITVFTYKPKTKNANSVIVSPIPKWKSAKSRPDDQGAFCVLR